MDLKELISYFIEQGLIGKRFLLASGIVGAWLYAFISGVTVPTEVTTIVGMVVAFYFGTHGSGGTANTAEATESKEAS
jgi:hypothetical protein